MAAHSALAIVKEEARNRIAAVHRRTKTASLQHALVRKAGVLTTAAIYGTLHRYKVQDSIGGFPWRLGVLTLAQIGEGITRGNTQAVMAGIADASLAVYVERSIATDTLVAGVGEGSYVPRHGHDGAV